MTSPDYLPHATVPSSHLGLSWAHEDAQEDIARFVRRCEEHERVDPRNSPMAVTAHFTPAPTTAVLVGRDSSGEMRAVATVRWETGGNPHTAALRAHIDPRWRGRGIGRAVLSWQDEVALEVLSGSPDRRVGVTIPSGLVDRRRLYTAAGFSSHGRIQSYMISTVSDAVRDYLTRDGVTIVPLADLDDESPLRKHRSPYCFIATGLLADELVAGSDPIASHVALRDGAVVGWVLAHATIDATGHPIGLIQDLVAAPGAAASLLSATLRGLADQGFERAHIRLSPEILASWEATALELGATRSGAYVVYTIEWP